jgi:hypothetical protein
VHITQLKLKRLCLIVSITGIAGIDCPDSGFIQSDLICPIHVPFKFGKGTSHPLNILNFHNHLVKTKITNKSIVTTFGIILKKDCALDKLWPVAKDNTNQAIAEKNTSR